MLEWAYSGVDFSLYGNGGEQCAKYLSLTYLIIESLFIIGYAFLMEIYIPWKRSVANYEPNLELRERFGRKLLLAGLCLIWGIEIGYKLSTRQLIFILNPCHVVTLIQLILLISPPRRWMHFLFRIQTYLISGATIAIIFPVLNTRHLPFEVASYYIHHALMLVTPLYLMRLGGIYNMEPLGNFHWGLMSLGVMRLYHYLVLQPLSFATGVNLNSIMCPAISDPFKGQFYRLAANLHQTFFIFIHGKLYCLIGSKFFVPKVSSSSKHKGHKGHHSSSSSFSSTCSSASSLSDSNEAYQHSDDINKKYLDANGNDIDIKHSSSSSSSFLNNLTSRSCSSCNNKEPSTNNNNHNDESYNHNDYKSTSTNASASQLNQLKID